jgi:hypothetical protein
MAACTFAEVAAFLDRLRRHHRQARLAVAPRPMRLRRWSRTARAISLANPASWRT